MNATTVKTSQAVIEYRRSGISARTAVLFVHGLGANQEQFDSQVAFFSQDYQVVTLNVRGHGRSRSVQPFSLANCAQDVIDLLDALAVGKCHFVGNSMGGNIGYEVLARAEDRLLSLTTFGTTAELNTARSVTKMLSLTYRLVPVSVIAALAGSAGETPASRQTIKHMMGSVQKETLLDVVPVLAQFNYLPVIAGSTIPIMIIRGARDTEINKVLPSTLAALAERGDFTLRDVDDVGHLANLDDPDRFNALLFDFLRGNGRGGAS